MMRAALAGVVLMGGSAAWAQSAPDTSPAAADDQPSSKNDIIIAKSEGKAVRFNESDVRPMGRTASGVRGVTLESEADKVVGMVCISREDANLLVVSEKGFGKTFDWCCSIDVMSAVPPLESRR